MALCLRVAIFSEAMLKSQLQSTLLKKTLRDTLEASMKLARYSRAVLLGESGRGVYFGNSVRQKTRGQGCVEGIHVCEW